RTPTDLQRAEVDVGRIVRRCRCGVPGAVLARRRLDGLDGWLVGGLVLGSATNHEVSSVARVTRPPVEPYPPAPRAEGGSESLSTKVACTTSCTMSWAIRSPRVITTGSRGSWLMSSTLISPR